MSRYPAGPSGPGAAFTAEQRRTLEQLAAADGPLMCPACGAPLSTSELPPARRVSYVRHRMWVICPACRRTAAIDAPAGR